MFGTACERAVQIRNGAANWVAFTIAVCGVLFLLPFVWKLGEKPAVLLGAGIAIAVGPIAIWLLASFTKLIPYLLISAVYLSLFGLKLETGRLNVRPNVILALIGACVVGWQLFVGRSRPRRLPFVGLLILVDVVYLLSTLRNPHNEFFWRGIFDCILFLANVLQYALIVWFLAVDHEIFDRVVRFSLYAATIYAGMNVFFFTLGELGMERMLDQFAGETGDFVRVSNLGTTEGTYIAFNVVVMFALLLIPNESRSISRKRLIFMLAINFAALLLTFARGPWLAVAITIVVLVVLLMISLPIRKAAATMGKVFALLALLVALGMGVLINSPALSGMIVDRFAAFSALEAGTVSDRMLLWANMWEDWKGSPWLGQGAHAYAKFRNDPSQISENFLLEFLHSTGVVGFTFFCFILGCIILRGRRLLPNGDSLSRSTFGLPILAGFVAMCLSSLTNPGMTGGFFWVGMAFVVCAQELNPSMNTFPAR